jgi:hypothetical protein
MDTTDAVYRVWALDDVVYGPVNLETLRSWILDERIHAGTWIYHEKSRRWMIAPDILGLRDLLVVDPGVAEGLNHASECLRPGVLRRVKVLAELNDDQLHLVSHIGEVLRFPPYTTIMKLGTPGDSMFFLLEGTVRLRLLAKGREILIALQEVGGVFGQISLFDGGPRVTDAVSDTPVTVLKIGAGSFKLFCQSHPEIATPILLGLGRTLASRIRTDDKHLCEIVAMNG